MREPESSPSTLFEDYDRFEQAKAFLLLGWAQQDIAEEVGVSSGTVSNYHRRMKTGDLSPPPESYQIARRCLRRLDKAGLKISEAEEIIEAVNGLQNVDIVSDDESDALSLEEIAEIASVAAALSEETEDKHDMAVQLSEKADGEENETAEPWNVQGRTLGEITATGDGELQDGRTMTEAVEAKSRMLN